MAKDEFDMDFDFEKEFGFDSNSFLNAEDNEDIDFSEFADDPALGHLGSGEDDFSDFSFDDLSPESANTSEDLNFGEDDFNLDDFRVEDYDAPAEAAPSEDNLSFDFGEDGFDLNSFGPDDYVPEGYDSQQISADDFNMDAFNVDEFNVDGFNVEEFDVDEFSEAAYDPQEYAPQEAYTPEAYAPQQAYVPQQYPPQEPAAQQYQGMDEEDDFDDGPEFISGGRKAAPSFRDEEEDFDATDFDEEDFESTVYGNPLNNPPQQPAYQENTHEEPVYQQPVYQEEPAEQVSDVPREPQVPQEPSEKPVRRRQPSAKPAKPPKPPKPPKEKTGPNILEKFLAYYLSPLKEDEAPQDPNNPRRRRRKRTKAQLFKEVYLPPILAGVTLILVITFVIGAISNAIAQKKLDNEAAMRESQSAAEEEARQEAEAKRVLEEAERLAMGYDYAGAVTVLESYTGEMTQEMNEKRAEYINTQTKLVEWKDYSSIPNLSFHVLIADPVRAFADKELGGQYNRNFVTIDEFTKILDQLYAGGYVLVDFDSFTESNTGLDGNSNFFTKPIALPEGKKPIMITETMVNYFGYMVDSNDDGEPDAGGAGFAYRLVVDENGDIRAQMVDANGQTQTGNYDLVPILEDFIKEHPDFCYQGARAILAVTGSQGVFGYRTNTSYISSVSQGYYDEQVAGAREVVQRLRDLGYTIACYTYDNVAYGDKSATQIQADMKEWTNQITPVIGEVDVLVYARTSDIGDYSGAKFQVLADCGFRFFLRHGSEPYAEVNNTYVRQSRLMVTGENMAWNSNQFADYFDCAAILNNLRGNVPKG